MADASFYFYDFETWGTDPRKDFPCQFAGIRTDLDLNPIGSPLNIYCQIPSDYLPQPEACLVTGITPQQSIRDGMNEASFIKKIHQEFSQPNTCVAGYNSIRFDDEVTRNTLYRNFYDPYAREWQHGNSRWDVIDVVRACYALRPDGIQWPEKDDGSPSFKLEDLTRANDIAHEDAHDAMSDVYGTIGLAKLVKQAQPKLFSFLFELRRKQAVGKHIDCYNLQPFVHVSSKLPASQGCCTWMVPVCYHPTNKNAVICLNLQQDPTPLFSLDADAIREKLYTPSQELDAGEERLPIKLVHINKCPIVLPAKSLNAENAERLGIDRQACLAHLAQIRQQTGLQQTLQDVYDVPNQKTEADADLSLYSGGFFSDGDKAKMDHLRQMEPDALIDLDWHFDDPRIKTLLFRYRARNFPSTLSSAEMEKWQRHRQYKLLESDPSTSIALPEFMQKLEYLAAEYANDTRKQRILRDLYQYASQL